MKDVLINAMEKAKYYYDDINSYDNWLVFRGDYCTSMEFSSWDDVLNWLKGVVFDDAEISDSVEKVLNSANL